MKRVVINAFKLPESCKECPFFKFDPNHTESEECKMIYHDGTVGTHIVHKFVYHCIARKVTVNTINPDFLMRRPDACTLEEVDI